MATKSKWFRIAVEGATASDNRTITAQMLNEMAGSYNRATYGARINMEHIRGYSPTGDFKAYGDVLQLKTEVGEIEIDGKKERRVGLYALIEPTDELVAITDAKQKIYTSMEVEPDFAKTGKFGLIGLAVTDSPASLGTDILKFSASNDPNAAGVKAMLDGRKTSATSFFSAAHETKVEWETATASAPDIMAAFNAAVDRLTAVFKPADPTPPKPANENQPSEFAAQAAQAIKEGLTELGKQFATATQAHSANFAKLQGDFDALKAELDKTEKHSNPRQPATGGSGRVLADF